MKRLAELLGAGKSPKQWPPNNGDRRDPLITLSMLTMEDAEGVGPERKAQHRIKPYASSGYELWNDYIAHSASHSAPHSNLGLERYDRASPSPP